jgi:hypothetical protein
MGGNGGQKTKIQNQTQKVAKPKSEIGAVSLVPTKLGADREIAISRNLAQSRPGDCNLACERC